MGPVGHGAISALVGAGVWAATGSTSAAAVALGVGVLVDVDHLYDYYQWYIRRRGGKLHLIFHAWEFPVVALLVSALVQYDPLILAAALGHLAHIATDHFHNGLTPFGYSIAYRAYVRFDSSAIVPGHNVMYSFRRWPHMLPLGHLIAPWFRKHIEPKILERIATANARD